MNFLSLILLIFINQVLCFNQIPIKSYIRNFDNKIKDIKVTEPYYVSKTNTSAIIFFTGGSSFVIPEIYQSFLNSISNNSFSIYSPSFKYKDIDVLVD